MIIHCDLGQLHPAAIETAIAFSEERRHEAPALYDALRQAMRGEQERRERGDGKPATALEVGFDSMDDEVFLQSALEVAHLHVLACRGAVERKPPEDQLWRYVHALTSPLYGGAVSAALIRDCADQIPKLPFTRH